MMSKEARCLECMKELQSVHWGHQPVQVSTIVDEDGKIMTNPRDECARWQCYFNTVLNIPSTFQDDAVIL